MLKKTGILGGTFDPIHIGHLIMAEQAYSQLNLDRVIIMPTGNPAYKGRSDITDKFIRADMVKAAIEGNEHLEFSDMELMRSGYVYTSDTLLLLKEKMPGEDFYLIIGGDSFMAIETWKNPEIIFELANIAVYDRPDVMRDAKSKADGDESAGDGGFADGNKSACGNKSVCSDKCAADNKPACGDAPGAPYSIAARAEYLKQKYNARITELKACPVDISSSKIRDMIRTGQSVKYLVSGRVEEYISRHGLYGYGRMRSCKNA